MTEPPAPPPGGGGARKRGLPKKLLGLPTPVVLAGGTALAVLTFLWIRHRRSGAAGTTPTSSATAATADAADLAGLQSELDQLLGGGGSGGGVGGGGGGSTVTTTSTPGGGTGTSSTGTTTGNPTSTATTRTGPAPSQCADNPVTNLRITDDGYTSLTASWNKSNHATMYLISVLQGGKVIKQQHAAGTIARVGNLKRGTQYTFRVRAQPGCTGQRDANVTATTKKG